MDAALPILLVVEDDRTLRRILCESLSPVCDPLGAGTCAAARAAVKKSRAKFGLLDYNLPDGTGLRLLEDLRGIVPEFRAMLLSGAEPPLPRDGTLPPGLVAALGKPIGLQPLLAAVRRLIRSRKR